MNSIGIPSIRPVATAATTASSAPTGLPRSGRSGVPRHTPSGPAQTRPAGPSEASTTSPGARSRRAATPAKPSQPTVSSSSWRLGLTWVAPASMAASKAGPPQSTMTRKPWARAAATHSAYPASSAPGGSEPLRTSTEPALAAARTSSRASWTARHSASGMAAPTSLRAVAVPSSSTTVTVRRVCRVVATRVSRGPPVARSAANCSPVGPPRAAIRWARSPSCWTTRATFVALPPACSRTCGMRWASPWTSVPMR